MSSNPCGLELVLHGGVADMSEIPAQSGRKFRYETSSYSIEVSNPLAGVRGRPTRYNTKRISESRSLQVRDTIYDRQCLTYTHLCSRCRATEASKQKSSLESRKLATT